MAAAAASVANDDVPYEEDVLRNPYSLKSWLRYIAFKETAPVLERCRLYERAVKELPGSYKLWWAYLSERTALVRGRSPDDGAYEALNAVFERSLVTLSRMPRIWIEYLEVLMQQHRVTQTRHTLDRALRALPVTQHQRVWQPSLRFLRRAAPTETVLRLYRRYLKLSPDSIEEFVEYLQAVGRHGEAAQLLAEALNSDTFVSSRGKSKHDLWLELCELITKNPEQVHGRSLNVDAVIRSGLQRYKNEVAQLWVALAEYYIRLGQFERARDVFEEAVGGAVTVRDFSLVWDAYIKFEDSVIAARMEASTAAAADAAADDGATTLELDFRLARYEDLINRRPLLLNSVLLRQNPHNVKEWLRRARLYDASDAVAVIQTYTTALKTVDAQQATGKLHALWGCFARYYETHGDVPNARLVFDKATQARFRHVEDLAAVWCDYAEMELRHGEGERARTLLQRATTLPRRLPSGEAGKDGEPMQRHVYKSVRLWSLYADVEENVGTLASTRAVYERIIELRLATPQLILNYARLLDEHQYFEDSYKAYEKGIALFGWPLVLDLWLAYLTRFTARFTAKKLERARDLFEQAVERVPAEYAKPLFLLYARLEEQHGLARHAMSIYDRACRVVPDADKPQMYQLYVARATKFFGVTRTRDIFERAIQALPERFIKDMCLRFANLERKLGEIDRARAIYAYAAQFCDPKVAVDFWSAWNDFEVHHGNEDTFKELLRIRRTVQTKFNAQTSVDVSRIAAAAAAAAAVTAATAAATAPATATTTSSMAAGHVLPTPGASIVGPAIPTMRFVAAKDTQSLAQHQRDVSTAAANPEAIGLDDDDDADADQGQGDDDGPRVDNRMRIEQLSVPKSVFGGIAVPDDEQEEGGDGNDSGAGPGGNRKRKQEQH